MSSILDQKRELLQDLDLIEDAISARIRWNPDVYEPSDSTLNLGIIARDKPANFGETLIQKHEIAQLVKRYRSQQRKLSELMSINQEEAELKDDQDEKAIDKFMSAYTSITSQPNIEENDMSIYDMFSSNDEYRTLQDTTNSEEDVTKTKRNIMSEYCKDLKLSSLFSKGEACGKFLDLRNLYKLWLALPRKTLLQSPPTYLEYLTEVTKFDDSFDKITNHSYETYLSQFIQYLKSYCERKDPLGYAEKSFDRIKRRFVDQQFAKKTNDGIYCTVCRRSYAKQSVYDFHLKGKKHKKALNRNNAGRILEMEFFIKELLNTILESALKTTKDEVQRFNLLSVRERQLELQSIKPIDEYQKDYFNPESPDYTIIKDGVKRRKDEEDDNPLKLPLGPDGHPIPYWLYKARGLKSKFTCEICGNIQYRGRSIYIKHFSETRHINGLKMLGVTEDFELFNNLSRINEVQSLIETLRKRKRMQIHFKEASEQVEDTEGNAMSKTAYEQLKKQGLI